MCAAPAAAAPPTGSDVATTSVGVQADHSSAVGETDVDVLLSERARLTFIDREAFQARLLADARFTLDTDGTTDDATAIEWNNVRQLGVQLLRPSWTLDVGRHPVYRGGPRLVDGAQLLIHPSPRLDIGAWGGLAPDLFTTLPALRPGGGPVVAYVTPNFQASVAGEALFMDGALDRLGALAMVRQTFERTFEVSGRADIELAGADGPHLSDLYALSIARPTEALRFDVFYNAFSTYKYQISELGLALGTPFDQLDPTVHHMVGGGAVIQPASDGTAPRVGVDLRQRFNANETNAFTRVHGQVGLVDVPLAGRFDALLDANWIAADAEVQLNPGVLLLWEPGDEGWVAVDLSGRALINPEYDGKLGAYADLFVDVITPVGFAVNTGVSVISEPDLVLVDVPDLGLTGYLRLSYTLRP